VFIANGIVHLPLNGAPSTHILKPNIRRLEGSVQNEALALRIATLCGLNVAAATTGKCGERTWLAVSRYDRVVEESRIRRIHQEDFCQVLGVPSSSKYENNQTGRKGPSAADIVSASRRLCGARGVGSIVDAMIFNVALTNDDSHAKNYSILILAEGYSVAPLYDLMVGHAWDRVTKNMAQQIGGKRDGRYIEARHWQRFAKECGISAKGVVARVEAIAAKASSVVADSVQQVASMPAGSHWILGEAEKVVRERCATLAFNLSNASPDNDQGEDDEPRISPISPL